MLIVGQQEEPAMAIMVSAMIASPPSTPPDGAMFYVLDGTPPIRRWPATFAARARPRLPHDVQLVE